MVLFLIGLAVYRDYGVSTDEPNQIEAGHVIWKFLCERFQQEVPEKIKDAPELKSYRNRFYGQAATFPTVIYEAIRGFSLDSSTLIRIRHLWNFLTYFAGLCCFALLLENIFDSTPCKTIGLAGIILLPRIFGDIFYNDRDVLLISWLMISLWCFYRAMSKPGILRGLLTAMSFAVTFNTRFFGLILLIFAFLFLFFYGNKRYNLFIIFSSLLFWWIISPIFWDDPLKMIPEAVLHLSVKQRILDTDGTLETLFFGKLINEKNLPWYYLPAYIFITTPLMTIAASLIGAAAVFQRSPVFHKEKELKGKAIPRMIIGTGMVITLFTFLIGVMVLHPTLYNGWRHFYFLYLPIVWLAVEGTDRLFSSRVTIVRIVSGAIWVLSFALSAVWMVRAHPYQSIYITPVLRKALAGKFELDYWDLSVKEQIEYLLDNTNEIAVRVTDNNWIKGGVYAFKPAERERIHTYPHKTQPYPIEYLFYKFKNDLKNEKEFDYYMPIHSVERDGIILSTIYRRSHYLELYNPDIIHSAAAMKSENDEYDPMKAVDNDPETYWNNIDGDDLIIQLDRDHLLSSIEIFPFNRTSDLPDIDLFYSSNGIDWIELPCYKKGTNGLEFDSIETARIRIHCETKPFGIREMLFYGQ